MMTFKAMASTVLALALGAGVASAQQLDPPIDAQVDANAASADSQRRVEEISTATDSLLKHGHFGTHGFLRSATAH